jgi:hypothetical protein
MTHVTGKKMSAAADRSFLLRVALCLGAAILAAGYWSMLAMVPAEEWNAARLYPACLMAQGVTPYYVAGSGPATGWIYGPVMPALHMIAAFAPNLTTAMLIGAVINLASLVVPIGFIMDAAARQAGFGGWGRVSVQLGIFSVLPLFPVLRNYLSYLLCDLPAIGLALLSCWLLARDAATAWSGRLVGAAVLAVLAVWTKQTAVLVPVAQLIHLVIVERDWRRGLRYLTCFLGAGVVVSAGVFRIFGMDPVIFNLWVIPGAYPLKGLPVLGELGIKLAVQAAPLLAVIGWFALRNRRAAQGAARPGRKEWLLFVTVAVVQIPVNLLGAVKMAGGTNSFHAVAFLLVAAALVLISLAGTWTPRCRLLVTGLLAGAGTLDLIAETGLRLTPSRHLAVAEELARRYPGEIYFPRDPLVTWWTERKTYHLESDIADQAIAGFPASKSSYERYLPARLRLVVYHDTGQGMLAPQLIPDLRRVTQPTTPFTIYVREPTGP